MTHTALQLELAQAEAAVEKGLARVCRQRRLAEGFALRKHEPEAEEISAVLVAFEHILSMFIEDRDRLRRELTELESGETCTDA